MKIFQRGLSTPDKNVLEYSQELKICDQDITQDVQMAVAKKIGAGLKLIGIKPERYEDQELRQQLMAIVLTKFNTFSLSEIEHAFVWSLDNKIPDHYGNPSAKWLYDFMNVYKNHRNQIQIEADKFLHQAKYAYYDHIDARIRDNEAIPKMICDSYQEWIDTKGVTDLNLLTRNCFDFASDINLIAFDDFEQDHIREKATQSMEAAKKADEEGIPGDDGRMKLKLRILDFNDYIMLHAWRIAFQNWYDLKLGAQDIKKQICGEVQSISGHCPLPIYRHKELYDLINTYHQFFPHARNWSELLEFVKQLNPNHEED